MLRKDFIADQIKRMENKIGILERKELNHEEIDYFNNGSGGDAEQFVRKATGKKTKYFHAFRR